MGYVRIPPSKDKKYEQISDLTDVKLYAILDAEAGKILGSKVYSCKDLCHYAWEFSYQSRKKFDGTAVERLEDCSRYCMIEMDYKLQDHPKYCETGEKVND